MPPTRPRKGRALGGPSSSSSVPRRPVMIVGTRAASAKLPIASLPGRVEVDPLLPFKIGPMNGREGRGSGLWLKASIAPRAAVRSSPPRRANSLRVEGSTAVVGMGQIHAANGAVDTRFRRTIIALYCLERGHGHWRLAARARPQSIRGCVSREFDRLGGSSKADVGRPQGTWRRLGRASPQAAGCD